MHLASLSTNNFRNLTPKKIFLSPGINLFIGGNAQGKTNILEAAFFFKFGRSFRAKRDSDMVGFGHEFCSVEAECIYKAGDRQKFFVSIMEDGSKRIKVGGKEVAKLSELVGRYLCILFGPQDMRIVGGFPVERRRFLDMTGSMTDRAYLDSLKAYNRILAQRNASLRSGSSADERRVWDGELIAKGSDLMRKRARLVEALRKHLTGLLEKASCPWSFDMCYSSNISLRDRACGEKEVEVAFRRELAAAEEEEIRRGTTLVGPHRDDITFKGSGRNLRRFSSQGEKRLFAILLRLVELSYLEEETKEPCVLLLDDVFSELDGETCEKLKSLLGGSRQIFFASPSPLDWRNASSLKVFHVSSGDIET